MAPRYSVKLVGMDGTGPVALPHAVVSEVAHELNGPGSIGFTVPYSDPHITEVKALREVQVWRDGQLAKWGVVVRTERAASGIQCQAPGLWWYVQRRVVGKPGRTNWLTNGGFETGTLAGWTPSGVAASVVTHHKTAGTFGAQLTQDNPNVDTWLGQNVNVFPGNYYTLNADIHIYSDYPYDGPAFEQRGLMLLLVYPPGEPEDVKGVANMPIDDTYTPGHTYPLQTGIPVPPDAPPGAFLQVRLYAPGGRVMWDDVDLTLMESLSYPMTDTRDIVAGLLAHAQDPAYGKTGLRIGMGSSTPATLGLRNEVFQHVDHANIGSTIEGYAHADFGLDFDIVHPTPTTRALQLWADRGVDLNLTLSLTGHKGDTCGGDGFSYVEDAENAVSSAIVQGAGSGPGRLEAGFTDTTITGGVVLEAVLASNASDRDGLAVTAREQINNTRRALRTVTLTTLPGRVGATQIGLGDRPRVRILQRNFGVDLAERMKAVRIVERPADGTLQLTLNAL